jgi:hypothetical protein
MVHVRADMRLGRAHGSRGGEADAVEAYGQSDQKDEKLTHDGTLSLKA